jgi:ABC-type multidrug transport system ATPase subunit
VGLDPTERIRFRNLLARLARGRIVFFSTHVAEDVEVACDRVIVMAKGRVVYDGPTSDLAALAEGRVWVASLEAGEEPRLESGARVVDVLPQASGRVQTRILSERRPHPEAAPEKPTLQDGYLWLTGPAGSVA